MQALKTMSLRLNQKMPSILGMVAVDEPRSVQASISQEVKHELVEVPFSLDHKEDGDVAQEGNYIYHKEGEANPDVHTFQLWVLFG